MSKPMGDTEKTVVVGALILGGWLGIDALVKRAGKRSTGAATSDGGETEPTSSARRRVLALRSRRRRRRVA